MNTIMIGLGWITAVVASGAVVCAVLVWLRNSWDHVLNYTRARTLEKIIAGQDCRIQELEAALSAGGIPHPYRRVAQPEGTE